MGHFAEGVIGSKEEMGQEAERCNRGQDSEDSQEISSEGFDPGADRWASARS